MRSEPTNLRARGQRRRAAGGILSLLGGLALATALYLSPLPWFTGFLVFPLFLLGVLGLLQAYAKT